MRKSLLLAVLIGCALAPFGLAQEGPPDRPPIDPKFLQSHIPEELAGKVFHWRYDIGWDFRVQLTEGNLHWEGFGGRFKGMRRAVQPHYRKVRDGIYFLTWNTPFGFDSLVIDLKENLLYAHNGLGPSMLSISGEIYCNGLRQECEAPDTRPLSLEENTAILRRNSQRTSSADSR